MINPLVVRGQIHGAFDQGHRQRSLIEEEIV